jgi:hypothetical protein
MPPASEQMRLFQAFAEGAPELGIRVNPFLLFCRQIEDVIPSFIVGKCKRITQVELRNERLAQHLRDTAALDQWFATLERLKGTFGMARGRGHRQPSHRPATLAQQHVKQFVLVLGDRRDLLRQRDFYRTLAMLLEDAGVGFQLVPACETAAERGAMEADMLLERGG